MQRHTTQFLTAVLPVAAFAAACGAPVEPGVPDGPTLREVRITVVPAESPNAQMLEAPRLSHREVLMQIDEVVTGEHLLGLFLRIDGFGSAWARAEDYKRALGRVREAGKPVHCYFEGTDNLGYAILATSCDRISMTPSGLLNLIGLRAQAIYARKFMEGLGLSAELLHVGKYKGAADSLTLDDMPETARQTFDDILDDLHGNLASAVAKREAIEPAGVQAVLDAGPYTARAALRAKLVDAIAFDDEAREHARRAAKADHVERAPSHPPREEAGLAELMSALAGEAEGVNLDEPHVALVYLDGTIVRGDGMSRGGAQAESFVRKMRRLGDDEDVRAVVLRIHSPGGSALASDLMWQAVRRVAGRKPVVASLGDMAASGGYYVAAGATEIMAEQGSLVGSIGVVGGKIVAAELAERIGVTVQVLRRGARSAWMSPTSRLSETERVAVQAMLESTYRLFVRRVGQGRKLEAAAVERVAQGRLMTGGRALKGKLIDSLGGLDAALARARELGGLDRDAPVDAWPRRLTFVQQLALAMGGQSVTSRAPSPTLQLLSDALPGQLGRGRWSDLALLPQLLSPENGPAALLPYGLEIR